MRRSHVLGAALSMLMGSALATGALAQSPAGMKLYAFSSGALTIGKGVLQNFGPMDPRSRFRWASS
jgi:N-acyl homoserine lactone hydrolase